MTSRPKSAFIRPSARRKDEAKFRPTMPSLSAMTASWRSVRLRVELQSAWALEWVATRGASLMRATSSKPFSFRCDRSITTPRRLHSRTSARPCPVSPGPVSGSPGKRMGTPCPKIVGRDQTGPTERRPAA